MELSNFTPGLALRGLQCGMMVKLRDNTRSDLDECHAEGQLSKICRKAKSLINFSNLKCIKESIYFLLE